MSKTLPPADAHTPAMAQYWAIKSRHPDVLLFYRMGDFYELFFEDARIAAPIMEVTLTQRGQSGGQPIPMAGVPVSASKSYLARLVAAGHRVAICEQMDPAGQGKGPIRREVVRIITPGTLTEDEFLVAKSNNYLAAIALTPLAFKKNLSRMGKRYAPADDGQSKTTSTDEMAIASLDLSTGQFQVTVVHGWEEATSELSCLAPVEVIVAESMTWPPTGPGQEWTTWQRKILDNAVRRPDWEFDPSQAADTIKGHFQAASLDAYGIGDCITGQMAAGAMIAYCRETQQAALRHVVGLTRILTSDCMILDQNCRRNLELNAPLRSPGREATATSGRHATLIGVMDKTVTAMGGRLLSQWLNRPLRRLAEIHVRLDGVAWLVEHGRIRKEIRELLRWIHDLERLVSRIALDRASPRDLGALRLTLERLPLLVSALTESASHGQGEGDVAATHSMPSLLLILRENLLASPPALAERPVPSSASKRLSLAQPSSSGTTDQQMTARAVPPASSGTSFSPSPFMERGPGGEVTSDADRSTDREDLGFLLERLQATLADSLPLTVQEGFVIRTGFHPELDQLRQMETNSRDLLLKMEGTERERTGISSLKIRYHRTFGYAIEVTNTHRDKIPYGYLHKQTLANAVRYVTPELKELEEQILHAEERLLLLEGRLFSELMALVMEQVVALQRAAQALATLDLLAGLAELAEQRHYCRPVMDDGVELHIQQGRHPVVEAARDAVMTPFSTTPVGPPFVPNDLVLDDDNSRLMLLTGPNMGGKSTFMRQVALIALMAQMGSFVPAKAARIGLIDRIFTRVGASDDLAGGQSTFMVEMTETAHILHHAGSRSLVILDEIGRGTATLDGLAIAWAVVERIHAVCRSRTLFATHYHQLTELERDHPGIFNCSVEVKEVMEDILFLHTIVRGAADRSYGIHVAQLAGLPRQVIDRAQTILEVLEKSEGKRPDRRTVGRRIQKQLALPLSSPADRSGEILRELTDLSLDQVTPDQALELLIRWRTALQ